MNRNSLISAIGDHVVCKLLPENDALTLAVLIHVLAGIHLARRTIVSDGNTELLRGHMNLCQALLSVVFKELDVLRHRDGLFTVVISSIVLAHNVLLGIADEDTRRRQDASLTTLSRRDVSEDAAYAAVVQDIAQAKLVGVIYPLHNYVRVWRRHRLG